MDEVLYQLIKILEKWNRTDRMSESSALFKEILYYGAEKGFLKDFGSKTESDESIAIRACIGSLELFNHGIQVGSILDMNRSERLALIKRANRVVKREKRVEKELLEAIKSGRFIGETSKTIN